MKRALLAVALALAAPAARAARLELLGELRASGLALFGSVGQFGPSGATGPCGPSPSADGGAYVSGAGLLLVSAPAYRYHLGLSVGYYGALCTDSLRRPLGGLDYQGSHRFGERTTMSSGLRASLDMFDRTLDIRIGTLEPEAGAAEALLVAGTLYLTGTAGLELEHRPLRRLALRTAAAVQTLQLFTDVARLSEYTTLGPMTAAEFQVGAAYDLRRDRLELPLRYRVSHFYPGTLAREASPNKVPPAQDTSVRLGWERRLLSRLTVRAEAGLAIAHQPHLCLARPTLAASESCSIDQTAPGIRGAAGHPGAEVGLGLRTTGTLVGEATLRYQDIRYTAELSLLRGYEPNAYASALDLVNRLVASATLRPWRDLVVNGTALIGHHGHTSPARLSPIEGREPDAPRTAPQNRTMVMTQGSISADWIVREPIALFAEAAAQVFAIRGEEVLERAQDGTVRPGRQVGAFPAGEGLQTVWRVSLLCGVRVFLQPPARETRLLQSVRVIP